MDGDRGYPPIVARQDWPGRCIRLISEQVNLLEMHRVRQGTFIDRPRTRCVRPQPQQQVTKSGGGGVDFFPGRFIPAIKPN